ncbi:folliculin [Pristis pectinata]|uniref:folliculin n=1 Tax=Pristis pectinata TaxID=685728 RepID=UPI00223DB375|nr:folliculin [Pristis pectinata]
MGNQVIWRGSNRRLIESAISVLVTMLPVGCVRRCRTASVTRSLPLQLLGPEPRGPDPGAHRLVRVLRGGGRPTPPAPGDRPRRPRRPQQLRVRRQQQRGGDRSRPHHPEQTRGGPEQRELVGTGGAAVPGLSEGGVDE